MPSVYPDAIGCIVCKLRLGSVLKSVSRCRQNYEDEDPPCYTESCKETAQLISPDGLENFLPGISLKNHKSIIYYLREHIRHHHLAIFKSDNSACHFADIIFVGDDDDCNPISVDFFQEANYLQ